MHPRILSWFWRLEVKGVIHAGAHQGEEESTYASLGFGAVTWIEAIPKLAQNLDEVISPPSRVINATLWSTPDEKMTFTVTSSSGSSSLFELHEHKSEYPDIVVQEKIEVTTDTLDRLELDGPEVNLLVLDLQGAEYQALLGATKTLETIDYVIAEVNRKELYKGIKLVSEIDSILSRNEFMRVATRWTRHGWGEALYIRTSAKRLLVKRILLRIKVLDFWLWLHLIEIPLVFIRSKQIN